MPRGRPKQTPLPKDASPALREALRASETALAEERSRRATDLMMTVMKIGRVKPPKW